MFTLSVICYVVIVCTILALVMSGIYALSAVHKITYRNPAWRPKRQNGFAALSKVHFPARVAAFFGLKHIRENNTLRSVNGDGSTFVVYKCRGRPALNQFRHSTAPRSLRPHETDVSSAARSYAVMLGEYVYRIPLLLRDLDFQLIAIGNEAGENPVPGEFPENPLEPYAITMHGVKLASFQILAFKAGRKAEELENAAIRGDLDFVRRKNAVFLKYMDFFLDELIRYLKKEELKSRD